MILGTAELLKLVKEKNLVEGLSERELKNPEGASFDLRVGAIYEAKGKGFLGLDERQTPTGKLIAEYHPKKTARATILPGKLYLVKTVEFINQPEDLQVVVRPRSTLAHSGIALLCTFGSPGHRAGTSLSG